MSAFFKPKKKEAASKKPEATEFISYGAAWLGELRDSDMPYLSVKVTGEDFERALNDINQEAEDNKDNPQWGFMMFPNRNKRDDGNDPDYYLVPHREQSNK